MVKIDRIRRRGYIIMEQCNFPSPDESKPASSKTVERIRTAFAKDMERSLMKYHQEHHQNTVGSLNGPTVKGIRTLAIVAPYLLPIVGGMVMILLGIVGWLVSEQIKDTSARSKGPRFTSDHASIMKHEMIQLIKDSVSAVAKETTEHSDDLMQEHVEDAVCVDRELKAAIDSASERIVRTETKIDILAEQIRDHFQKEDVSNGSGG